VQYSVASWMGSGGDTADVEERMYCLKPTTAHVENTLFTVVVFVKQYVVVER
jgi:hypothetical protein